MRGNRAARDAGQLLLVAVLYAVAGFVLGLIVMQILVRVLLF